MYTKNKASKKINYKNKRIIFLTLIFIISIFLVSFILSNFKDNIVFFYSPSEIEKISNQNSAIRVGGMIKQNSIIKLDALNTKFIITDYKNDLTINYRGILPDLFREDQGVVAKGKFNQIINEFDSNELLVKHDENYMPPEVAENLKMKIKP